VAVLGATFGSATGAYAQERSSSVDAVVSSIVDMQEPDLITPQYVVAGETAPAGGWTTDVAIAIKPEQGDRLDCSTVWVAAWSGTGLYDIHGSVIDCTDRRLVVSVGKLNLPEGWRPWLSVQGRTFDVRSAGQVERSFTGYVTTWHKGEARLNDIAASQVFFSQP